MATGNVKLESATYKEPSGETLIVTGVLTVTQDLTVVGAESGTADDLATVNLSTDFAAACVGYQPVLRFTAAIGDSITLKHGTGNVLCNSGADITMTENKIITLVRFVSTTTAEVTNKWRAFE